MVFKDVVRGEVRFNTDVIGDPVLLRSDGHPAYNFAVVVDDALMQVTHVIRGEDHISNTPRQILLYEAFGWTPPVFAHVSLVMGPDHSPLSKRHGATSVKEFRDRGYLPEALANYLALIGWSPGDGEELLPIEELAQRFRLEDVGHSAGIFDVEKLAWVNRHYLKLAAPERLARLSVPYMQREGWLGEPSPAQLEFLADVVPLAAASVDRLEQVPTRLRFLFDYSAERALEDPAIRAEAEACATSHRGAGRGARVDGAARRSRALSWDGHARAGAHRREGQVAVPPDQARVDRRSRRAGARSRRARNRARGGGDGAHTRHARTCSRVRVGDGSA